MRQREWQNRNPRGNLNRGDSNKEENTPGRKGRQQQKEGAIMTPLEQFKQELKDSNPEELDIEDYSVFSHPVMSSKEKFYTEKFRILPCDFM
jgi:hypothetical protein